MRIRLPPHTRAEKLVAVDTGVPLHGKRPPRSRLLGPKPTNLRRTRSDAEDVRRRHLILELRGAWGGLAGGRGSESWEKNGKVRSYLAEVPPEAASVTDSLDESDKSMANASTRFSILQGASTIQLSIWQRGSRLRLMGF